jgi:uncharacterized protein YegP (UPF0339 family)
MAAKYDVRTTSDGQYYFNLKAANGKIILTSERYTTEANASNGIRSVRQNATTATRFDRRTSRASEPYFVLKARNGEPIGRSEMYSSKGARDNGIRSVETNAPTPRVDDLADSPALHAARKIDPGAPLPEQRMSPLAPPPSKRSEAGTVAAIDHERDRERPDPQPFARYRACGVWRLAAAMSHTSIPGASRAVLERVTRGWFERF